MTKEEKDGALVKAIAVGVYKGITSVCSLSIGILMVLFFQVFMADWMNINSNFLIPFSAIAIFFLVKEHKP